MKLKFNFLIILLLFFATNSFAIPRCEQFYQSIYNDTKNTDVFLDTHENKKVSGIRLLKYWDKGSELKDLSNLTLEQTVDELLKIPRWNLKTNKDGYYIVGKITKPISLIEVGDVVLSINGKDIRTRSEFSKKKEKLINNVSDLFEENEIMEFKLMRNVNGKNRIFTISNIHGFNSGYFGPNSPGEGVDLKDDMKIYNSLESYDEPYIDFYINSLEMNEKEGNFKASIETFFKENLDDRYFLTQKVWEDLIYDKKFNDKNQLVSFRYEYCNYDDEKWKSLNTVDPAVGLRFDNVIKEDKNTRTSSYTVSPDWSAVKVKGYQQDESYIEYTSTSTYTFKNKFNLKSFPFDKQKVKIYLYNYRHKVSNFKALISDYTQKRALEFKELNNIEGWNITNVNTSYEFHKDPNMDSDHDGISVIFELERKSSYYLYKIIFPIILILLVCWSSIWINPIELESRLTITIVCLLSLIAYNFVIDSDLPKLEYLTIMDYIILISYVFATIPNFLTIITFSLLKKNKNLALKFENYGKKFGLPSYLLIIFIIVVINTNSSPENTNSMLSWMLPQ